MTGTLAQQLLAAAAVVTALGVLWRTSRPLRELVKGTRLFLVDWFGTPERPGVDAVAGFPERMARVERRTADLAHDFRGELTSRLTLLAFTVDKMHDQLHSNGDTVRLLSSRVDDHRRRNEAAVDALRAALAEQQARLDEIRNRSYRVRHTDPSQHDAGLSTED